MCLNKEIRRNKIQEIDQMRRNKPKGRKIYKTKEKNYYGKSPLGKFLSGALTVLLIGGIGFIGYSAAEPIINYTQHKGDQPEPEPEVTEPFVTKEFRTTAETPTATSAVVTTAEPEQEEIVFDGYMAAALPESAMGSPESISYAISAVPGDRSIEYIEVPLKAKGGKVWYSSNLPMAQYSGAVQSQMTLQEIVEIIENNGYKAAAVISAFEDSILPLSYPDSGYVTIDDGSQWIDNWLEYGGKPWITPYSQTGLDYLSGLVDEISGAGFDKIICADLKFPYFRESDLELLDERLSRSDRCMALTSAANSLYNKCLSNGASMFVEVSAADIIRGSDDVLQPMLLSASAVVLNIDLAELSAGVSDGIVIHEFSGTPEEITEKALSATEDKLKDFNISIRISGTGYTTEQLIKAEEKAAGLGYRSFVLG